MAERQFFNYDELYELFVQKFGQLTGLVDDFNTGSVLRAFAQSTVFFVNFLQVQIQVAFDSFRVKTAKATDLDNRVADWQMTRVLESFAEGSVVFMRDAVAEEAFIVPQGTIVSTVEDVFGNTIDYSLNADIIFASGAYSTTGTVTCLTAGLDGNVTSGKIINMKETIDGVDSITNPEAITNGADTETDDQLRARVPLRVNGLQAGNQSAILAAAYSVPGVTYAKVKDNTPTVGEFTVYFTNFSGVVDATLRARVATAVDAVTDFCVVANYAIPTVIETEISLSVEVSSGFVNGINYGATASGAILNNVKEAIYAFTQLNTSNTLRISDLIVIAKDIPGVKDVSDVEIGGVAANKVVNDFEVIKLVDINSITIAGSIG